MLKYLKIRTLLNLKTQPISIVYIQIQNRIDLLRTMDELAVDPSISRNIITQDEDPTVALVVTTEERPTKLVLPPVVEHECFHILSGRSKGTIGTKNDRIKLIHDVLLLDVSEYLPPIYGKIHPLKNGFIIPLCWIRIQVNGILIYLQEQFVILILSSQNAKQMLPFWKTLVHAQL